jgi:glutamyl-tRNA synthetase
VETGQEVLTLSGHDGDVRSVAFGPDGRRLAKRHGDVTLGDLRRRGVPATALLGSIAASLGLARPGSPVSTATQLVTAFDPDRLPDEPWWFDPHTLAVNM